MRRLRGRRPGRKISDRGIRVERLTTMARSLAPRLVAWRRHLHAHPELSFEEHRTAAFVADALAAAGIRVERPTATGVVGVIAGRRPGPAVVLRADMDALPIQEQNEVEYASRHPGIMHACGHDGHTAILLGAGRVLADLCEAFPGEVRLVFQPAEERPPGGALDLIAAGVLEGAVAAVGLHLWADLPVGKACVRPGPVMANADEFTITVHGRGGHGSQPHRAVDALVVAAQLVLNLQTVVSRRTDPLRPVVISVGTIQAGYAFNVIAPTATLTGTVRTFDPETRELVRAEIERVVHHTCAMAGATGEFQFFGGYPAVVNDPGIAAIVADAAREALGPDGLVDMDPSMGGEDFAYIAARVPSCYVFLGAGNPAKGIVHPHHHPRFDIDEDALPLGVELLCRAAMRLLTGAGRQTP